MPAKKFAISVPEDVMDAVDGAARERGVTRSRFISDVLRQIARVRTDAQITRRIDELLSDPELAAEQRDTASALGRAATTAGTEW